MNGKGIFTISIDTEVAWGQCDRPLSASEKVALAQERTIVQRLLALFGQYDIRATWAVVGHLLVRKCSWDHSVVHPEVPRPVLSDEERDWFFQHPPHESADPAWYGRDIVELIRNSSPAQEIGSHSFCHMPFDERRSNPAAVRADLTAARALHEAEGLPFESFIFPRNVVGFRELLAGAGLKGYRGNTDRWHDYIAVRPIQRLLHLGSYLIGFTPPTVKPYVDGAGLVNVPDSMLLIGRNGLRRMIAPRALLGKAVAGLRRAVARGEVFHLWFHPSNFAYETDAQFQILERILGYADRLRKRGQLEVLTMGDHIKALKTVSIPTNGSSTAEAEQWRAQAVASHDAAAEAFRDRYDEMEKDTFVSSFAYGRQHLENYLVDGLRHLPANSRVLDVGCGTGDQIKLLRRLGYEAVGLEPSARMRAIAAERNPGTEIHDGVIGTLPFPSASFDAVIAIEVLRYLHATDIQRAYSEVLRVLKPGGLFIFTMVNRYALDGFFLFDRIRGLLGRAEVHCEFVTPRQVRRGLSRLGVKDVQCAGQLIIPLRIAYRIHPTLGARLARWWHRWDSRLSRFQWTTPFAGHLSVVVRSPQANSPEPSTNDIALTPPLRRVG